LNDAKYCDIIPGFESLPLSFRPVLPYLLASIVHHKEFLVENLPISHPLFQSRLWSSGLIDELKCKVLTGCGENPISQLSATCVPPTLVVANGLVTLTTKVK
jgi:hypothetical protein